MRGIRGISRVIGGSFLLLGIALPFASGPLLAQTAEERARAEMLRQREEIIRQREQERRQREQEIQRELEQRRLELEKAMAEARDQQLQARLRAREFQAQARNRQEEVRTRYRERLEEIRQRARDQERDLRRVVVRLRARVRLGVSLDGDQGEEMDRQGVEVQGVMEGSPAQEAGLRAGDIITHLNGQSLIEPIAMEEEEEMDEDQSLPVQRLISLAGDLEAGEEVELRYLRDGTPSTVSFEAAETDDPSVMVFVGERGDEDLRIEMRELARMEDLKIDLEDLRTEMDELRVLRELGDLHVDIPRVQIRAEPRDLARGFALRNPEGLMVYNLMGAGARYGLRLTKLNPGLADYFSTDEGLLVLDVDEDSELGLSAGDVILGIDGRKIEDQQDLLRILSSYEEDETVSFTVMRNGQEVVVEGRIR